VATVTLTDVIVEATTQTGLVVTLGDVRVQATTPPTASVVTLSGVTVAATAPAATVTAVLGGVSVYATLPPSTLTATLAGVTVAATTGTAATAPSRDRLIVLHRKVAGAPKTMVIHRKGSPVATRLYRVDRTVKAPIVGVLDRQAAPLSYPSKYAPYQGVIRSFVVDANWSAIEPTSGQRDWSSLDTKIAGLLAWDSAATIRIRLYAGIQSPAWAMAACGTVQLVDSQSGVPYSTIRGWTPEAIAAMTALLNDMGQRYDSNPAIRGVNFFTGGQQFSPEWTITGYGSSANRAAYVAAGYNADAHIAAVKTMITAHAAAFPHTTMTLWCPTGFQYINADGTSGGVKYTVVSDVIAHAATVLGSRLEVGATSAAPACWTSGVYPTLAAACGSAVKMSEQTEILGTATSINGNGMEPANPDLGYLALRTTLTQAAANGRRAEELPAGYADDGPVPSGGMPPGETSVQRLPPALVPAINAALAANT
jgi:hypothetical protein